MLLSANSQTETYAPLREEDAYPALAEDGYGWEKLFSERMRRHFNDEFGLTTRVARYHNVYGPQGTWDGGREKAPAAVCRKVAQGLSDPKEIEILGDGTRPEVSCTSMTASRTFGSWRAARRALNLEVTGLSPSISL